MDQLRERRFLYKFAFWVVILAIVYVFFKYLLHLVMPFLVALIFAMIMRPLVRLLVNKLRLPKGFAGVLVTIFFYLIIGTLLVLLFLRVISGLGRLFGQLPDLYRDTLEPGLVALFSRLENFAGEYNLSIEDALQAYGPELVSAAGNAVTSLSTRVVTWVSSFVTSLPAFIIRLVICIVATFFMSADYERMTGVLTRLFPERMQQFLRDLRRSIGKIGKQYGLSYFLILGITFSELLIGLAILRVNRFVLIAFLIAVLDIFPVLGTGAVLVPWAIIAFIQGRIGFGIGLLVLYALITIIRQIIEPKIVGKHVGMHPIITLACMFIGTSLFGGYGLFGLPILVAIVLELNSSGAIHIFKLNKTDNPNPVPAAAEPEAEDESVSEK